MIDNTSLHDVAAAWVETLLARGVSLQLRGKRLAYHPRTAYSELSNEERATLKQHKAAIVNVVRERYSGTARATTAQPADTLISPPAKPAPPCPHCYQSPCIGEQHELYELLHALTEAQAFRRRMAQAEKDARELELRRRYGLPSPTWG